MPTKWMEDNRKKKKRKDYVGDGGGGTELTSAGGFVHLHARIARRTLAPLRSDRKAHRRRQVVAAGARLQPPVRHLRVVVLVARRMNLNNAKKKVNSSFVCVLVGTEMARSRKMASKILIKFTLIDFFNENSFTLAQTKKMARIDQQANTSFKLVNLELTWNCSYH